MKIKLLMARATATGSEDRGDVIEVSSAEGARMIDAGQAVPVRAKSPEKAVKTSAAEKASK